MDAGAGQGVLTCCSGYLSTRGSACGTEGQSSRLPHLPPVSLVHSLLYLVPLITLLVPLCFFPSSSSSALRIDSFSIAQVKSFPRQPNLF